MAIPFSRSLLSLKADNQRPSLVALLVGVLILGGWLAWFLWSEVPVHELSAQARLEVSRDAYSIDAPVAGTVVALPLALSQEVSAGQVLVELDTAPARLKLQEARARRESLSQQLTALRAQLVSEETTLQNTRKATDASLEEARALLSQAETSARFAEGELRRTTGLLDGGFVAEAEHQRTTSETSQRQGAVEAQRRLVERLTWDARAKLSSQQAHMEDLRRQAALLEGEVQAQSAQVEQLDYELTLRTIRAPAAGRVAALAPLRTGMVVRQGDTLASVVPTGELKVIADFPPPAALGRIRPGQPAQVRLDGFPWVQYGSIQARVSSVASEARAGIVRVEFDVQPDSSSAIPRQHGLTGSVEVEVERTTPARLVLRAVGERLRGAGLQGTAP
ncbi:HlyD family secretion protein [Hyalangium minutum]|uniref:Membrane fusion component of tripartite multidrug resistance system n=1 Tax=Hyalangium minutum TaxID=394096 RepID=A0A085WMG2_9BACT|nr:HlyD family efflux transporter periplasmic adaptor subunit [Hyalangium minutum]KFE68875.1 Membrane fusion component of tripartite multidrug resistance system [Hyalangium minutum]